MRSKEIPQIQESQSVDAESINVTLNSNQKLNSDLTQNINSFELIRKQLHQEIIESDEEN